MLTGSEPANDAEHPCSSSDLSRAGQVRDETAGERDRAAQKRDELAAGRDREADIADRVLEQEDDDRTSCRNPSHQVRKLHARAVDDHRRAAGDRVKARNDRELGEQDRAESRRDREHALEDERSRTRMNTLRRRDMEVNERATRENLERIVELRTTALADALTRVEAAAAHGRVLQAETVHRWAQSAEHRDPGIGRHVKRVSHYCALLGDRFGLHYESLSLASALHDVGKHAIPDSILLKAGPLTADERLAVETHAEVGYEMLRGSCNRLLDLAAVIARTHHEKFDGSGYPRGLSGESIPLEGRIAAVADVFDALTSDRVYRPAWSVESALAWMSAERGKHFDPEVLDAFVCSIDEVRAVQSLLTDARPECL